MRNNCLSRAPENPTPKLAHESPKRTKFIRFVGRTLLAVIILVGLAMIINWLLLTPKNPTFAIENGFIHFHSLTDTKLNASFYFQITSFNGNRKASVYTVYMKLMTTYKDQIAETIIPPFLQSPGNKTFLNVTTSANFVSPFGGLEKVVEEEGIVLELHLRGRISYKIEKWTSKSRSMEIYCDHVVLRNDTSRENFERTNCKVDL